jgi:SAM-dependent methyltransferase
LSTCASDEGQNIPLPPENLRKKVLGPESAEYFVSSGHLSVQDLGRALASIGRTFDEFTDVLEWGCGCGRILRHLQSWKTTKRIHGNDIDRDAISWINQNLPWVATSTTDGMPPLPYADDSFDLIFNHSVLTHLNAAYQDAWLAELGRVVRPGGVITLTVHGQHAFRHYLKQLSNVEPDIAKSVKSALRSNGMLFVDQDNWSRCFPDFYHTSFHDVSYIFDHWRRFLDVRSYIVRGVLDYQDMVVLQKRTKAVASPNQCPSEMSTKPAATESQQLIVKMEYDLVIGLTKLAKHLEDLNLERTRNQFINSKLLSVYASPSWRLTRPLRAAGRLPKQVRVLIKRIGGSVGRRRGAV